LPRRPYIYADCGHQGLPGDQFATDIPDRKTAKKPLTRDETADHHALGGFRARDEHYVASLSSFKMLSKRHGYPRPACVTTFAIIAGIVIFATAF
jgi:hypothetical protein